MLLNICKAQHCRARNDLAPNARSAGMEKHMIDSSRVFQTPDPISVLSSSVTPGRLCHLLKLNLPICKMGTLTGNVTGL